MNIEYIRAIHNDRLREAAAHRRVRTHRPHRSRRATLRRWWGRLWPRRKNAAPRSRHLSKACPTC